MLIRFNVKNFLSFSEREDGKSEEFYKIGRNWFKDKDAYINYLKSGNVTYQDILELLTEDKNMIISSSTKDKIIELIMSDHKVV